MYIMENIKNKEYNKLINDLSQNFKFYIKNINEPIITNKDKLRNEEIIGDFLKSLNDLEEYKIKCDKKF
jgi:hypothetical protein